MPQPPHSWPDEARVAFYEGQIRKVDRYWGWAAKPVTCTLCERGEHLLCVRPCVCRHNKLPE